MLPRIIILTTLYIFLFNTPLIFDQAVKAKSGNYINVEIKVSESFVAGERMSFDYIIKSDVEQEVSFIPYFSCKEEIPQLFPTERSEIIAFNKPIYGQYDGIVVDDNFPRQFCYATIELLRPYNKIFKEKVLINTKPKIDLNFGVCADANCGAQKKNFNIGEPVYLDVLSRQKFDTKVEISSPSGEVKIVKLPYIYTPNYIGKYKIKFFLDNPAFQPIEFFDFFNVRASVCHPDGQCIAPENKQNCPQDCLQPQKNIGVNRKNQIIMLLLILTGITVLIIGILVFYKNKNRTK